MSVNKPLFDELYVECKNIIQLSNDKNIKNKEPQMLISLLVKEITLFNDKMIIQYNTPIANSPDESRGFNLLSDNVKFPLCKWISKPKMIDYEVIMKV